MHACLRVLGPARLLERFDGQLLDRAPAGQRRKLDAATQRRLDTHAEHHEATLPVGAIRECRSDGPRRGWRRRVRAYRLAAAEPGARLRRRHARPRSDRRVTESGRELSARLGAELRRRTPEPRRVLQHGPLRQHGRPDEVGPEVARDLGPFGAVLDGALKRG